MQRWKSSILVLVAVCVALVSACSSATEPDKSSSRPVVTPVSQPFRATVSLGDFSSTCAKVACWLPTQFKPALAKGQTVSLRNKWPMDGNTVTVVCMTKGQIYRDQTGAPMDDWYGILVPITKLAPGGEKATQAPVPYGGRVGFVGIPWITGGEGKQAPAC